jgi:peroxiredoxin
MLLAAVLSAAGAGLGAQERRALAVGDTAPDFALTGATVDGVLASPIRLGDFRDQTVVIAFFYRARTRG